MRAPTKRRGTTISLFSLLAACLATPAPAQEELLEGLRWRCLGPAVMSGRVVDVEVHPADPNVIYAAAASGGVWKTTNRGTTWQPLFDDQPVMSIGDIALSPGAPDVVWVGTGEANNQRSSYWGDGVYRSTDGGRTFRNVGLPESHHVGRIVVHPDDPDTAWVAALGHLYTPNEERGLYRTKDGGRTWEHVLRIDADTGVVDVVLDPEDPDRLYAASYQRRRRAWHFDEAGPGSGIWRSKDGGDTWERLEGGLPDGRVGRIGLAVYRADPRILYACVENRNPRAKAPSARPDPSGADDPRDRAPLDDPGEHSWGVGAEEEAPGAAAPEIVGGEVYRSEDGGDSWTRVNEKPVSGRPPYYYGQIRVDPTDDARVWLLGVRLFHSEDAGRTWKSDGARGIHVDHHALWIDPADPRHMLIGNDGGLAVTWDRGRNWDVFPNLPLAQFYTVFVDDRRPYRIYGGLQDNGTFMTPSRGSSRGGILDRDVLRVGGGDGFYVTADPEEPDVVYGETQFGNPYRIDLRTGRRKRIKPRRGHGEPELRCNWMSPLVISPHNPRTVYFGSQRVHRSRDRGDTWEAVSPDLTTDDPDKTRGNVPHCTITTLSVSPLDPRLVWAGTDDGRVHVTQDGGLHWRDVSDHFPDAVQGLWVSRVVASSHEKGRAYVSWTGYREDHFEPYVFVTEDFGGNFASIVRGLPPSPVNVVREDRRNPALLFAGTEHGAFCSLDRGDSWRALDEGMPPVAVHDLAIQHRVGDLVAATHGRGLYVIDVAHLRELTSERRRAAVHLCPVKLVPPAPAGFSRGYEGARRFVAPNPRPGAHIAYHLRRSPEDDVVLEVRDVLGNRVRALDAEGERGLNRVVWDLRGERPRARRGRRRRAPPVPPGDYLIVLEVGEEEHSVPVTVPPAPAAPALERAEDAEADDREL